MVRQQVDWPSCIQAPKNPRYLCNTLLVSIDRGDKGNSNDNLSGIDLFGHLLEVFQDQPIARSRILPVNIVVHMFQIDIE